MLQPGDKSENSPDSRTGNRQYTRQHIHTVLDMSKNTLHLAVPCKEHYW